MHSASPAPVSACCPSGRFVPREVLANMVSRYGRARHAGYPGSRVCGEMSRVLHDIPGADRFLEYEVRINTITETFPYIGMCQYDARHFDGATLFKVLQVYPFMIAQGSCSGIRFTSDRRNSCTLGRECLKRRRS